MSLFGHQIKKYNKKHILLFCCASFLLRFLTWWQKRNAYKPQTSAHILENLTALFNPKSFADSTGLEIPPTTFSLTILLDLFFLSFLVLILGCVPLLQESKTAGFQELCLSRSHIRRGVPRSPWGKLFETVTLTGQANRSGRFSPYILLKEK